MAFQLTIHLGLLPIVLLNSFLLTHPATASDILPVLALEFDHIPDDGRQTPIELFREVVIDFCGAQDHTVELSAKTQNLNLDTHDAAEDDRNNKVKALYNLRLTIPFENADDYLKSLSQNPTTHMDLPQCIAKKQVTIVFDLGNEWLYGENMADATLRTYCNVSRKVRLLIQQSKHELGEQAADDSRDSPAIQEMLEGFSEIVETADICDRFMTDISISIKSRKRWLKSKLNKIRKFG